MDVAEGSLRRTCDEAAGTQSGSSGVERATVNTGTARLQFRPFWSPAGWGRIGAPTAEWAAWGGAVVIPKPGGSGKVRRLGIPTVADRVVQAALKLVLEPIFEADFVPVSYGFRPMRRAQDAIAEIQFYGTRGYEWVHRRQHQGKSL